VHKILVIDDNPTGAGLLIDLLHFAGYQGVPLENWEDPVAYVEQEHPDLVIMDVHLGAHDGLDLLRQRLCRETLRHRITVSIHPADYGGEPIGS